jgi:hypothetical protein
MSLLVRLWYKLNNQPDPPGPTEGLGFAGPSLVVKSRNLIRKRVMMRARLMARR